MSWHLLHVSCTCSNGVKLPSHVEQSASNNKKSPDNSIVSEVRTPLSHVAVIGSRVSPRKCELSFKTPKGKRSFKDIPQCKSNCQDSVQLTI